MAILTATLTAGLVVGALAPGAVMPAGAAPSVVSQKLVFQPAIPVTGQVTPAGYTRQTGAAWTDAAGQGWVSEASLATSNHVPLDLTKNPRYRNRSAPVTALQNSLIHAQYGTSASPTPARGNLTSGAFELAVPNGWYRVAVSVGDQGGGVNGYDSQHSVNAEGLVLLNRFQASAAAEYAVASRVVMVGDGRLTVDAIGGVNTKINYLEVDTTTAPVEPTVATKVRFADEASAPVPGYLKDFGQAYGNRTGPGQGSGQAYGWRRLGTTETMSVVGNGRNRVASGEAPPATPPLLAGLVHMQLPASSAGVRVPAYWELAVPSGTYAVAVSVGDAGPALDAEHWLNVEGQNAVAKFVPTGAAGSATHHSSATRTVTVTDGRLTLTPESGTNTKINWVTVDSVAGAAARPSVARTTPGNLATAVSPTTSVVADLNLVGSGVLPETLAGNVTLTRVVDRALVAGSALTSGGGDTINFSPTSPLADNTSYRLTVTDGVTDRSGRRFLPYSMVFTTGTSTVVGGPIAFTKTDSGAPKGASYTTVVKGPDGKLYAGSITGEIYRFDIGATGTLSNRQTITTVPAYSTSAASGDTYRRGVRTVIGLAFDPASTANNLILWVTDNAPYFGQADVPNFTSRIAKLTGANLQTYTSVVEGLPRSIKDHEANSIAFGPDGRLYVNIGSLNAMGAPDSTWGNRSESTLSAATLRLDPTRLGTTALNARTDGAGTYSPYATNAPLTIYASGIRNAYDLVWHTNGSLYVPTNGSAAGGNTPAVPSPLPASCANRPEGGYTGQSGVPALTNNRQTETDYVFRVRQGKYYGHPNPSRCEWVLNNGNPTAGADPFATSAYPVGTTADPNYDLAGVYDAGIHASADGAIEYRSNHFGGALRGKLLYVRYSSGQDIVTFDVASDGRLSNRTIGRTGFTGFSQPLDLTEDTATGNLYVTQLTNDPSGTSIVLLKPSA